MNYSLNIFFLALTDYMLPCLNKQLFGFECPGCGLQRAVIFLIQGEFLAAFKMYPAIYTLIPLFGLLIFNKFLSLKYANQIIIALSIASVSLIMINYIFKLIY
ncbi:MAG: DUF2752 domain-containing protein [Croceitalea sp.]|nr:DUF2752 domain-containing protein [Croceitalea sp.]MBT8237062.1 DUF2752 domain-containing protein [Croceitalea sp.]NNC33443.1 DUF2752 domain-containing protein [Croceitalea sp.]NNL08019.1 DUF2752 domain-containing protein [Croceitalea sp.]NNM17481.1 DUF2752 domain-containing protein [Croceitalea sp.]